jgi:predicted DNA-binding transcriptional regulator
MRHWLMRSTLFIFGATRHTSLFNKEAVAKGDWGFIVSQIPPHLLIKVFSKTIDKRIEWCYTITIKKDRKFMQTFSVKKRNNKGAIFNG